MICNRILNIETYHILIVAWQTDGLHEVVELKRSM